MRELILQCEKWRRWVHFVTWKIRDPYFATYKLRDSVWIFKNVRVHFTERKLKVFILEPEKWGDSLQKLKNREAHFELYKNEGVYFELRTITEFHFSLWKIWGSILIFENREGSFCNVKHKRTHFAMWKMRVLISQYAKWKGGSILQRKKWGTLILWRKYWGTVVT